MCANIGCDNKVSFADIEVVGEGFACSPACAVAVEELVAEYNEFSNL